MDEIIGEVVEDFRSEILGFLGSSPNYQKLYQKALLEYFRDMAKTDEVGCLVASQESPRRFMVCYIFTLIFQDGSIQRYYENFVLDENGSLTRRQWR